MTPINVLSHLRQNFKTKPPKTKGPRTTRLPALTCLPEKLLTIHFDKAAKFLLQITLYHKHERHLSYL